MAKKMFMFTLLVCFFGILSIQAAFSQQVPLNPNKIPQFVEPLPLLSVQGGPIETVTATLQDIFMREFKVNVLPTTIKLPNKVPYTGTWVWGYRTTDASPGLASTYIGPVFVATRNTPTEIKWVNNLPTGKTNSNLPFWWTATDQTLHWADPLNSGMQTTNYDGPVPAVVHLHGGEVPPVLDGGPDAWFTSDGNYIGPAYYSKDGVGLKNYSIYRYPNGMEAAPTWFHDHVLGITRLNVYAGLAGAYILTDNGTNAPNPTVLNDPAKIIPIVIQDRMFDTNGQLYFPNVGINPEHPFWVPEFVGDTIVVNGKSWPFLNVGLNTYRFLFLNGSNARAYELDLFDRATGLPGPPMWVIGTDGGYLDNPVKLDPVLKQKLVIMPGERYDVIVNFSAAAGYAGQVLELRNTARTPYPGGAPVSGGTTGRIMRFNVQGTTPTNPPTIGYTPQATDTLRTTSIERVTGGTPDVKRQLTLNEVMGAGGPLEILVNNTKWAAATSEVPKEGDVEVWEIINLTVDAHPIHTHLTQFQLWNRQAFDVKGYTAAYAAAFPAACDPAGVGGVYCPAFGPPLDYNTVNLDGAVGGNPPLQNGPLNFLLGLPVAPLPQENGWKDTVIAYPGQVTRIAIRYQPMDANFTGKNYYPFDPNALNGDYVWHCHIIDHEDNEMMRPTQVDPLGSSTNPGTPTRTYVQGRDY